MDLKGNYCMDKKLKKALIWPAVGIPIAMMAFMIDWRATLIMLVLWAIENKLKQKKIGGF